MKKILLSFTLLLMAVGFMKAQINETFESGTASLNWVASDDLFRAGQRNVASLETPALRREREAQSS